MHNKGNIYLIPTPLGENPTFTLQQDYNFHIIEKLEVFIVEELRTARRFLRKVGYKNDFDSVTFYVLNEHTPETETMAMISAAKEGKNIGLLSEAGLPCVADPGHIIVRLAHQAGIRVIPLIGASSIMLALMASGFNGQNFAFNGYLPVKPDERIQSIKKIEQILKSTGQTQIFIETPYRNQSLFQSLIQTCSNSTGMCIAADITLETEFIRSKNIGEWKNHNPEINKRPAVFLLGVL